MILISLMLAQAAYAPETEAVMNRSLQQAKQAQAVKSQMEGLSLYLPSEIADKLQRCIDAAIDDPAAGMSFAREWIREENSFSAQQCLGFVYARTERWAEASAAFDKAASQAQTGGSASDAARLWAQAGNASLAADDAVRARGYFDKALEGGLPDGLARGEALLDRARALVVLHEQDAARADLNEAIKFAAEDPLTWLLSATLARRMNDLPRAAHDIAEAKRLASDDASVALEAGNIAVLSGDENGAKAEWSRVLILAPSSDQAAAAREMLGRLEESRTGNPPQSR